MEKVELAGDKLNPTAIYTHSYTPETAHAIYLTAWAKLPCWGIDKVNVYTLPSAIERDSFLINMKTMRIPIPLTSEGQYRMSLNVKNLTPNYKNVTSHDIEIQGVGSDVAGELHLYSERFERHACTYVKSQVDIVKAIRKFAGEGGYTLTPFSKGFLVKKNTN